MAPTKTPIDQGLIDRLSGKMTATGQWLVRNIIPASWMNPGQPLQPVAQDDAQGRQWDYPVGYNLRIVPRQEEPTSFPVLRGFADSYDLLRLLIETRKDQICGLAWSIHTKDGKEDSRTKQVADFLATPNQLHPWDTWLRMVMEDLLVIDAPAVFVTRSQGGQLYSLDPIDGSTIRPLIDHFGRPPAPPSPCFQQYIKGVGAADYTREDLIYLPRNMRTHKVYGLSPVEQILATINIGLRRQIWQLSSFTEGNVPDALIGVPETWTPQQIAQFQALFDSLFTGDIAARSHRAKFIPGGMKVEKNLNDAELFGKAEEWLARVCCYAFSISPQPFVKETNRATAQTAKEASEEEGIIPLKRWVKNFMDLIIVHHFGYPDIEFKFTVQTEIDTLTQAQIDQIYITNRVYTQDYVRDRDGIDSKYTPEEPEVQEPATGGQESKDNPSGQAQDGEKLAKAAPTGIDHYRDELTPHSQHMAKVLESFFAKTAGGLAASITPSHQEQQPIQITVNTP